MLLDKRPLQKPSRFLRAPWVYQALMASLASPGTLGLRALSAYKALKVCPASLARMAPVAFLAHLGLLVILVYLDCKAPQDLKELRGSKAPSGGPACLV